MRAFRALDRLSSVSDSIVMQKIPNISGLPTGSCGDFPNQFPEIWL